jgi:molybdopterin-guanine dinucleotide biosynthesis protein A
MPDTTVAGIVVAGGASRRLGFDKRRLRLWGDAGPTLLEHTLDALVPLCAERMVVLNDPDAWPHLPARLVTDRFPGTGVLGGIVSGLQAVAAPAALVLAADLPLLNAALLRALLARPRTYHVLLPRPAPAHIEPLHALYRCDCLPTLRAALQRGTRRMTEALHGLHLEFFEPHELARYDPHGHALLNLNTPDDLARARELLAWRGTH